jgi:DNA-binding HxlR family transcriptional regulator
MEMKSRGKTMPISKINKPMPISKIELIMNPIRIRILTALSNQKLTTHQIAIEIPDIPQTTLYRQINTLVENGLIHVAEENPIRGTVERVYQIDKSVNLTEEDVSSLQKKDLERLISVMIGSLLSEAQVFLNTLPEQGDVKSVAQKIEFAKTALFLNDAEFKELNEKLRAVIRPYAKLPSGEDRKRTLFSFLFIPSASNTEKCC